MLSHTPTPDPVVPARETGEGDPRQPIVQAALEVALRALGGRRAVCVLGEDRGVVAEAVMPGTGGRDPLKETGEELAIPIVTSVYGDGALFVDMEGRGVSKQSEEAARLVGILTSAALDGAGMRRERQVLFAKAEPGPTTRSAGISGSVPTVGNAARRILVVEDDLSVAESVRDVLVMEGYQAMLAFTGREALACARAERPDLILMDVQLPDLDGFSVAQELAGDPRTGTIPIVVLSGVDDLPERVRGWAMGDLDFLTKPYGATELIARIERSLRRAQSEAQLHEEAHVDALTGLGNLRLLEKRMAIEGARIDRYHTPLTIVALDLDHLKTINDRFGHATGSACLQALGQALSVGLRDTDIAARTGGDEFVVVLPHTELAEGERLAERLLARIRELRPASVRITASIGVAAFDPDLDGKITHLLERADAASYRAKRLGRDRVWVDRAQTKRFWLSPTRR